MWGTTTKARGCPIMSGTSGRPQGASAMASTPPPDRIDPQSPPDVPPAITPQETPAPTPNETPPVTPDRIDPVSPDELPAPD